jgi:RNA polymerase sigma factor (sigma-70 family)
VLEHEAVDVVLNGEAPELLDTSALASEAAGLGQVVDDTEGIYREHYHLLLYVACRKFRVPEADAEGLIQEIFISYLSAAPGIRDVRAWLVAAVSNASRHFWRSHGRTESLPEDYGERSDPLSHGLAETLALRLTVQQTLGYLEEKCRETLRLHYFEGCSAMEVARQFDTTNRYAEKLIHNCLKRALEIYKNLTAVKRA